MKEIDIKGADEKIYVDNSIYDMPVYMCEKATLNGFYLCLGIKYGSLHTNFSYKGKTYEVPKGIAHYMEHLKFNEKKGQTAHDYYNKIGSDINAFTTFEYTNYEVSAHDNYKENLSHLIKYVLTPYFTKEIINKERGIITEEIKMDKDNPYSKLFYRSLGNLFEKSHYKELVSGEITDIKKITLNDINLIYDAFYHPSNMFLVVCGNINKYETMQIVNDTLKKLNINDYIKPKVIKVNEPLKVVKKEDVYEDYVSNPKAKLSLKIPISKFKGLSKLQINIYSKFILGANFGHTSDFMQNLIDEGMVNYFNASRSIFDDYLVVTFNYESNVYDAVKDKVLEKLKKLEVDSSYLKRIIKCNISDLILMFESKEAVSNSIQDDIIFYGDVVGDIYDLVSNIKVIDLNKLTKTFNTSNYSYTVVTPKQ